MITNIYIRNFRSIRSIDIKCDPYTTFVGPNDAGKSNVLRALNLFFCGQTDHGYDFDFERDFNRFASVGKNKAKEIIIEITFRLPDSYQKKGKPKEVIWRKAWRYDGIHSQGEKKRYKDKSYFSDYSKIPALLGAYPLDIR